MNTIVSSILQKLSEIDKPLKLAAIDGRCAAGKTTLSAMLEREAGVSVIHMDDFFLRPEQRTVQRMEEPGGNVDYERFLEEVMLPLSQNKPFSYHVFDCKQMKLTAEIHAEPKGIAVIEGSYSCHPALWDFYDLRIFIDVDAEEQLRRINHRNGAEAALMFKQRWIPLEEKYFSAFHIKDRCDLVYSLD